MPGLDEYDRRILMALIDGEPRGFNELRRAAKISPKILRGRLGTLAKHLLLERNPGVVHPGGRDRIAITNKGRGELSQVDSEKVLNVFDWINSSLKTVDAKALRQGQASMMMEAMGRDASTLNGTFNESYKRLCLSAVTEGNFTKEEEDAFKKYTEEVLGPPGETLALALKIDQQLSGYTLGGKVPGFVVGVDLEGHLVRILVSELKKKGIGKNLADHVE